ncbi:LysR family transcriptional regulator [Lacrimispora indolis]|uniref:LysR family transcriptional regulator n=1 Tax=Lacrimispora indolis TaxID=69825 RepID=UPI0018DECD83|nr:LysR family transcriptional regulator [[Clostridium] methoxybenzovorans]
MMMNLETLETFLKVAGNHSFTQTAAEMFCSQAAVSIRMKSLEKHFGTELFERDNNRIGLTKEGKLLLPYVKTIMETMRGAEKEIYASENLKNREIRFACSGTPGTYIFPPIIHAFSAKYPSVTVVNHVEYTQNVFEDIESKAFPFGFVSQPFPPQREMLLYEELTDDPLVFFASTDNPLSRKDEVGLEDLVGENLMTTNPRSSIVKYLESAGSLNFPKKNIHAIGNIEAVKKCVVDNKGIGILSVLAIETERKYGVIKVLKLKDSISLTRKIYAVFHKDQPLSLPDEVFLDFVKDYMKSQGSGKTPSAGNRP